MKNLLPQRRNETPAVANFFYHCGALFIAFKEHIGGGPKVLSDDDLLATNDV